MEKVFLPIKELQRAVIIIKFQFAAIASRSQVFCTAKRVQAATVANSMACVCGLCVDNNIPTLTKKS